MPVARVGDEAVAEIHVSTDAIDAFAKLSGDDNPIHLDEEYAADTMFDGRVAHGMLSAGVVSATLAELPGDIVYLSQELMFENPVYPGEDVRAEVAVVEELGGDRIAVTTSAFVPERDERVLHGKAVVLSVPHETG